MSGEHITREDLVDTFSSLPEGTRNNILMELNKAITETEEEAQDGCIPSDLAAKSLTRLNVVHSCLLEAIREFNDIKGKPNEDNT